MGHGHAHTHTGSGKAASPQVRRALLVAVLPFAAATLIGLILLWPSGERSSVGSDFVNPGRIPATVTSVEETDCEGVPGQTDYSCSIVNARLDGGVDRGETVSFTTAESRQARKIAEGDEIFVGRSPNDPDRRYFFLDYQRALPLVWLGALFAIVVVLLSRLRGLTALIGLALSMLVLIKFVLPAILEGQSPALVAIVGSSAIMFAALYLAHGINVRTTTAVLGTLASLLLTLVLALYFLDAVNFTGFASEEAVFLQVSAGQVNLRGLLLGGVIIGTLGVLDDVTVTQASAVWEIHLANPRYRARELYGSAVRIGRDHIASTVNTLVLAYAGASLPLLVLFQLSEVSLGDALTSEVIAEEVVRTLVGSIGLVASVPITTGLAALVVSRDRAVPKRYPEERFRRPRAEREFREIS